MEKSPIEITVITDTHYYSKKLGVDTPSYREYSSHNQKTVKESAEIITAAFNQIAESHCKNVIFCGDATCDGDPDSHREFIELLYALQKSGKRIFAITSTHDYRENDITYKYTGAVKEKIPSVPRSELSSLYYDFGPKDAISVYEDKMSYISDLDENYRILALNSDNDGNGRSGFSDKMCDWIKLWVKKSRSEGKEVIAFTHHPILSPSPVYSLFGKNDLMHNHGEIANLLADLGVELVFTGHSHIHDISYMFSKNGNVLYDISTATPAGYPGYYRRITLENNCYRISSEKITKPVPIEFNGKNLDEHLENVFLDMIRRTINAAASSTPEMAEGLAGISVKKKTSYRYGWLIHPVAKAVIKLNFGKVYKWVKKESGLSEDEIQTIKNDSFFDFITELILHLYAGDAPFTPDTPQYRITMGLCAIAESFSSSLHIPVNRLIGDCTSLSEFIEPLLFNKGICDKQAVLPKKPTEKDIENLCFKDCVPEIKSKKGLPLAVASVVVLLLLIPFLPLTALILGIGFGINGIKYRKELKAND